MMRREDRAIHDERLAETSEIVQRFRDLDANYGKMESHHTQTELKLVRLEEIRNDNVARLSSLIYFLNSRPLFKELSAQHDQYFELESTVLNSSMFNLNIESVVGQIGFRDRQMLAELSLSDVSQFPIAQGAQGTFRIRVVPASPDTVRILLASAQQYPWVEINFNSVRVIFRAIEAGTKVETHPFMSFQWKSDVYTTSS
jgi:hypothetical protein